MISNKSTWGLVCLVCCILSVYLQSETDGKHWTATNTCREAVALLSYQEEYNLPYETCRSDFQETESKPYQEKILELDQKASVQGYLAFATGVIAFFILTPIWLKWGWRFFLARLAEVSSAIRGQ